MKTLARIFGILAILISLLTCVLSFHRAGLDKTDAETELAEANKQLDDFRQKVNGETGETKVFLDQQIKEAEKIIADAPSGSAYIIVQIFIAVLILLSLTFGVFLFKTNRKLALQLLAGAVIVTIVLYFASPDIPRGKYSGMASRSLALLSGIPVIVAGLCAVLAARKPATKASLA